MANFCLIINEDKFYVWQIDSGRVKEEYFNGQPYFSFSASHIKEEIDDLINILLQGHNLAKDAPLRFILVFCGDKIINKAVDSALGDKVVKRIELDGELSKIMWRLNDKPDLYIDKFGINYDGHSYKLRDARPEEETFSLLAYTIFPVNILQELVIDDI